MGVMQQSGRCYSIGRAVSDDIASVRTSPVLQARDNHPKVGGLHLCARTCLGPKGPNAPRPPRPPSEPFKRAIVRLLIP